jgi:Ca-activated chloride channel family protein
MVALAARARGDVVRSIAFGLVALATIAATWLDPHATAREAARLYAAGKFDDAAAKYREALVDDPDSPLLHFNLGAAAYREKKFDDAVAAYGQVPASDANPSETAGAAYNAGNAKYRLGAELEASKPQEALQRWAEALVAYRRAMGADPADEDAKFNHEFVEKRIADLQKKLEDEKQKREEQKQQQQDQQQQGQDQQKQDQQRQDQQKPDQQQQQQQPDQAQQNEQKDQQNQQAKQPEPKDQEQQGETQQKDAGEQQQPNPDGSQQQQADQQKPEQEPTDGAGEPGEQRQADEHNGQAVAGEPTDQMSQRDAEALLDAQRDQELRPDEMVRQQQGAQVAEPREDW